MTQNETVKITKDNIDSLSSADYNFYVAGIRHAVTKKKIKEGLEIGLGSTGMMTRFYAKRKEELEAQKNAKFVTE